MEERFRDIIELLSRNARAVMGIGPENVELEFVAVKNQVAVRIKHEACLLNGSDWIAAFPITRCWDNSEKRFMEYLSDDELLDAYWRIVIDAHALGMLNPNIKPLAPEKEG